MSTDSGPLALFAVVRAHHHNTAWRDINPMYAETLMLAITSKMVFEPGDFAAIVERYNGGYWLGDDARIEDRYRCCIEHGHPSAAVAFEAWRRRPPFEIDGKRVYVGKFFDWEGVNYRCTSITNDLLRAKRNGIPATLIEITRSEAAAKIAAEKAEVAAQRLADKEAQRADPVPLRTLDDHFRFECAALAWQRWDPATTSQMAAWAASYGVDYQRAWKECANDDWLFLWAEALSLTTRGVYDVTAIRKRHSWPKVEQAIFRFVRRQRGLPLRDLVGGAT